MQDLTPSSCKDDPKDLQAGLKIRAELDRGQYPTGIKITDAEMASLNLKLDNFHGDWNYTVMPTRKKS